MTHFTRGPPRESAQGADTQHHRNAGGSKINMLLGSRSCCCSRCPTPRPTWGESSPPSLHRHSHNIPNVSHERVLNNAPLCSIFQPSWDKILHSTDAIAASHHLFAQRIEKDVEQDLRQFQSRKEFQNMTTMSANLSAIAKELEDAKEKADKLTKKGGKASALKVDQATARLESATGQWESQAPFILETLQALDEQRCNHLRDVLTQLQTHEVDQADRLRATANDALTTILEADTSKEVENFATRATGGRVKLERRAGTGSIERTPTATRQSSVGNVQPPSTADSSLAPPLTAASFNDDDRSDHSTPGAEKSGTCQPC